MGDMMYTMEELLPVLGWLVEKYTSKESTSVTYERAELLMGAVTYCIDHCTCGKDGSIVASGEEHKLSAMEAYRSGYQYILEQTKAAQDRYSKMIGSFCSYGNENYRDVVEKALPGFFLYYDPRFAPREHIITMDYPVPGMRVGACGIDAIAPYVDAICLEQEFMGSLPEDYICRVLRGFHRDYGEQIFNICFVVLRSLLCCGLLGKGPEADAVPQDYERLGRLVLNMERESLLTVLKQVLVRLIERQYDGDRTLREYLARDLPDFAAELENAAEHGVLPRVAVL